MRKCDDQPIISWVSDVKKATFQLKAASITTINKNIILALTEGLPESFSTFIIALDNLPLSELTLDNIITRLLNEEVRQMPASTNSDTTMVPKMEQDVTHTAAMKGK